MAAVFTTGLWFAMVAAGWGGVGNGQTATDARTETVDGDSCNAVVANPPNAGHQHTNDCDPLRNRSKITLEVG